MHWSATGSAESAEISAAKSEQEEELDHGKDYRYPHDYPNATVAQEYFPESLENTVLYEPKAHDKQKIGSKVNEVLLLGQQFSFQSLCFFDPGLSTDTGRGFERCGVRVR